MIEEGEVDKNVVEHGVLHFGIGESFGALMTDMAREKAWYGCQRAEGILFLMRGLGGIDMETAEKVVDGKLKLVTNDDHKTLHEEKDNWTPPDFKKMRKEISEYMKYGGYIVEDSGKFVKLEREGSAAYKARPRSWRDMLPERDQLNITLEAQRINELLETNIWKALSAAKQFKNWLDDLMIENSRRFKEWEDSDTRETADVMGTTSILEELKEDTKARIAAMPMDPEMKERMLRLTDSQFHDADIKEDPEFKYDTGWLDRDGHYYSCELGLHIALADKIVKELLPRTSMEGESYMAQAKNAERLLEELGWMKCTGRHWYTTEKPPTEAQIRVFKHWCEKWPQYKYNGVECGGPGGVEE
jgi:hypothetical protein